MAINSRYKLKTGEEVEPFPPIQNTDNPYLTEAAMHADQSNQLQGYGYLVTDVGAFIYLGTVAGTAADYKAFMPTKDISLRSDNTASTIYFYDALGNDVNYAFIRYNAATNYLEFGSNDGQGDVVSAQIDRGKTTWEFKNYIIINNPGRGVQMKDPAGAGYELRTNDGGVLELWSRSGTGSLETLVWSSATSSGLDLRASNLAADLNTAEQDGIKTKIGASERQVRVISTATYTVVNEDKNKLLLFTINGGDVTINIPDGTFPIGNEKVVGFSYFNNIIFNESTGNNSILASPGEAKEVEATSKFELDFALGNTCYLTGSLIKDYEIFKTSTGVLKKLTVNDDDTITVANI